MKVKIYKSRAKGTVSAPPSKSAAHRMLICAALAGKGAVVEGIAYSKDILATLDCISAMGIEYERIGSRISFYGKNESTATERTFNCNESGSTLRFFIPLALCDGCKTVFQGSERLMSRPLDVYREIFDAQGIRYNLDSTSLTLEGRLAPGVYNIKGNISSQFITGLLLALPLVGGGEINIIPPVESRPYIDMTVQAMEMFGVKVEKLGENSYKVNGNYSPCHAIVEGDHSNAAFLDAFGFIGGDVNVTGLTPESLQGDKIYKEYFERIKQGYCTLDISNTPDLGPVLMAMGAVFEGVELTGTARLKIKESDRGEVMKSVLSEFSVATEVMDDRIIVKGRMLHPPSRPLDGYNDHRIVMSEALLLSLTGGEITGAQAVSKSYPDFFDIIEELGIKIERSEP